MNSGAATVHYVPDVEAWFVTGVTDDGQGHQKRFFGDDGRNRAMAHAAEMFKTVTVVEQV